MDSSRIDFIKGVVRAQQIDGNNMKEKAEAAWISIHFIDFSKLSNLEKPSSGFILYLKDEKKYTIAVNNQESEHRQRFTFAHELWHYFLHRDVLEKEWIITDDLWASYLYRPSETTEISEQEKEADQFAAEVLMPEDKFRELYNIYKSPSVLSSFFNVSEKAVNVRIYKLRLWND